MKKLLTRTLSGTVYVALFVFCIYSGRIFHNELWGNLVLGLFLLFVAMVGTFEYYRMFENHGEKAYKGFGFVLAFAMFALWWNIGFVSLRAYIEYPEGMIDLPFIAAIPTLIWPVVLLCQLWCKNLRFPKTAIDHALTPAFYIAIPLGLMPLLNSPQWNVLMMVVALTWVNDSFAYLGGSLIGKHKLWVRHSPGKTWEGCIVGMIFCVAAAMVAGPMFETELRLVDWMAVGLIVSIIGTLGDLVESMMKRHCEVKDSGNIMPGHGGLLDRFDSLLMIAPFVFLYIQIIS